MENEVPKLYCLSLTLFLSVSHRANAEAASSVKHAPRAERSDPLEEEPVKGEELDDDKAMESSGEEGQPEVKKKKPRSGFRDRKVVI